MFFKALKNIDFAGYADDNTPYTCFSNIEEVLENLQWKTSINGSLQITW